MANSILQTMQDIENEAKAVLADYDSQIQGLRSQSANQLDSIKTDCDQKTQAEVAALEEDLTKETALLKEKLADTIAKNDSNVRSVLTDKKDDLVQQIVDRVVEKYGN
ncbi:V/A-type H+-transporting ATPase subunit G/H [Streptococcus henryi]|uniref:V/A-type H+-transporting ATPase subunit G/H n=1 Tax=Streptococcus henryi TaxID=439219 RepID=A0A1G6AS08_9STRE|nr:hypothetical protein [Streptococcus henryi]SDB11147.1 V/A-type H+-transporting ATPase subunit G/H [Streptococcus henryi]